MGSEDDGVELDWDCEDAIAEFLAKGRNRPTDDLVLISNMQLIRTGVVTRTELDRLIIDNKIQFNKMTNSVTQEVADIKVGDFVQYWLEQGKCVRVELANRDSGLADEAWEDDDTLSKPKSSLDHVKLSAKFGENLFTINGKISDARSFKTDTELKIDLIDCQQTISVRLSQITLGGPVSRLNELSDAAFFPSRGDWVRLTLTAVDNGDSKVVALEPLRWNNFEGEVTRIGKDNRSRQDFAVVEQEIFIPQAACVNGYRPIRGEWVGGLAFESAAPEGCSWRAVNVYPRPQSTLKPRSLNSNEKVDFKLSKLIGAEDDSELLKHVEINGDVHFGQVLVGNSKTELISVTNRGENSEILGAISIGENSGNAESAFEIELLDLPLEISASQRVDFRVTCRPKQVGIENTHVKFYFSAKTARLKLSTYVEVEGVTEEILALSLSAPSQRFKCVAAMNSFRGENHFVVPGERPVFSTKPRETFIQRLGGYEIPLRLKNCLEQKDDVVVTCPFLAENLTLENYVRRFGALLHMEEFAIQKELDLYQLGRVFFSIVNNTTMALKVPGLQEQRPSLLVGDKVIATDPSPSSNAPAYEGNICEVQTESVLILFSSTFHAAYNHEDYNVSFKFNRTPFRRCHQAIESAILRLGQRILFPQPSNVDGRFLKEPQSRVALRTHKFNKTSPEIDPKLYVPRLDLTFFNPTLNGRQRIAVLRIVEGLARPIPYILYGPPGTGKTMTLVEVILQLHYLLPGSRILACAPSNSAADLICSRLHLLNEMRRANDEAPLDMVRLNAAQRKDSGMDDEIIKRYHKSLEDIDVAVKSRIVVATCTTAGQMYTANVKPGSFSHVLIDEAGHATEPETLIPINFVDTRNGQIVLAGDPQQLGPILESRLSNIFGLQVSLLERLSKLPVYCRDETRFSHVAVAGKYNPLVATKLVNNYRSHPALFNVSSRLFYDDELLANAPENVQNLFVYPNSTNLPNPAIPFVLHSVQGRDLREGESLSWFNCHEVILVISYLKKLMVDGFDGKLVSEEEIGIITPYRKQIEKIRLFIDRAGLPRVKVGTVEEFQGQERSVIILSIVRSTESADVRQALGFLANPKRMNVSLTRAKSLLVVIANPFVLLGDPYWTELTRFAVENRCCLASEDVLSKLELRLNDCSKY